MQNSYSETQVYYFRVMKKILFLCHGNICRSPMAEAIFKDMAAAAGLADAFEVASAAVSDEEIGNPVYPPAQRCLNRHGIPFDRHRQARRVTAEDYVRYDCLVVMDAMNLRMLRWIIGEDTQGKVKKMMSFAGIDRDVADPWYTGDFETTFRDIRLACEAMLKMYK